jgi:uncharacterized delta-60 repeat protein
MKHLLQLAIIALSITVNAQTSFLDNSFNIGTGFNSNVISTSTQSDNKVIVGGSFNSYNGYSSNCLIRINSNGTIDNSFNIGTGYSISGQSVNVTASAIQSDGKIIIVGNFDTYNGVTINRITRLNPNGSLDGTFNVGSGFNGQPRSIQIQADGKILIGGIFSQYNGVTVNNVVRLNSNGSIDNSFTTGSGLDGAVRSINLQNDGKIILAGFFTNFNGSPRNKIVRLNVDGTIDLTFDPLSGPNGDVYCSKILNNGKIIIGGAFSSVNGILANNIACLNNNGTLDNNFVSGVGFNSMVNAIDICNNGKIIAGGLFTSYNGNSRGYIARLNVDGSIDNSFNSNVGFNNPIYTLEIQNDSKIMAGGPFTTFDGIINNKLCRLIICEQPTINNLNVSQCNQYVSPSGNIYFQSGNFIDTLQSLNGCDSVYLTLNVNILNSNTTSFSVSICNGDSYLWNNQSYDQFGSYTQVLQNLNGCDSTVTMNLIVNPDNFNPSMTSNQQLFNSPPFAVQFSNTTANIGNYNFTWYWGDGTSTTSNNPTVFHEYLTNGLFTITLEATNTTTGCNDETTYTDYIFTTGGVSCTHTATINQSGPINSCVGQPVILTCNSDPSFSYQWRKNGIYIPGNNNDTLIVTQSGSYSVIISVNGCPVASSNITVNFQSITQPTITSSGTIQPCIGGSVDLTASSGYSSYLWSNGANSQTITVSTSGNYTVQGTGSNGCTSTSIPYTINASFLPTQNICVVGVDSLTNNIRVVWEESLTSAIDSFYIYKESNVSNVYTQIGSRAYDSLSVWIDPVSNPAVQSYRYKITALDTCGVETPLSNYHKTIHLTINQGVGGTWNLIWSHYEGINFGSYNIYRGTSSSNMTLLNTIQSNLNSFTDLAPPTGAVYYQIEIVNPNNCTPTKSTNYSSSKSNIVTNAINNTVEIMNEFISVYPNPTTADFTIEVTKGLIGEGYTITDCSGRLLKSATFDSNKEKVELGMFSNGVYLIQIKNRNIQQRIVKQ